MPEKLICNEQHIIKFLVCNDEKNHILCVYIYMIYDTHTVFPKNLGLTVLGQAEWQNSSKHRNMESIVNKA